MANTNAPFGFRQYGGTGSVPTYEQVVVRVAYNASAIFYGDPVLPDANGFVVVGAPGTTQVSGIFQGCKYLSVSQKRTVWSNYWPGTDVASNQIVEGYIVNDPNSKFVVQTDVTGIDATAINANVNFSIGTGNTATGISGAFLNTSTLGTTNTLPFRVVGLVLDPPGAPGTDAGAYNLAIVAFNNVSTKQLTGI
jgi:hypothetical protein